MNIAGIKWFPVLFFSLILLVTPLAAEELTFYSLPEEKINLDLQEKFARESPFRRWVPLNGTWLLKHPESGEALGRVRLPCTFRTDEKLVFEKKFDLERKAGWLYELHLGPVNGEVQLLLNDSLLYRDSKNYLPVSLSLPFDILHGGENTLEIRVQREDYRSGDIPAFLPANMPRIDAGILQAIYLEIKPAYFIESINARATVSDSLATLEGSIVFNRPIPASSQFQIRIAYQSSQKLLLQKIIAVKEQISGQILLPEWPGEKIAPWSAENPVRYWIEVALDSAGQVLDQLSQPLALRSLRAEEKRFFMNGQRIMFRGINYVYQNTEGSELFDPDLARMDLEDIKARGFNAIRVIMHPLPEEFYRICDEVGLLCFQDLPFVLFPGGNGASQRNTLQRWQEYYRHLTGLAGRYNSITAAGLAFYIDAQSPLHQQKLKGLVSRMASPRSIPVYASTLIPAPEIFGLVDFQIIDIILRGEMDLEFQRIYNAFQKNPFFPSAFSKAYTYRADSATVTYDLRQINDFFERLTRNELPGEIEGHFIPTYSDFYLQLPSLQNGSERNFSYNRVGLVDIKREPRMISPASSAEEDLLAPPEIGLIYEEKAVHSFIYILAGFLNVVVFLISYRRYRVFRQNISYSIRKPHGFFVNLQERISIPYKQSFFLMLIIAVNGAIVYSSVVFFYRNNLLFDYLLSLFFYIPWLKQGISRVIWDQPLFLIIGTVGIILIFYFLAFIVKLFSFFGKSRVLLNQALAASIWSAAPFVILLPLGIFMYNILLMMKSYWIIIGLLLYFHVWFYFRWINGVRVLTDRLYFRVFILFTFLILVGGAAIAHFYNQNFNALEHLRFLYNLYAFTN